MTPAEVKQKAVEVATIRVSGGLPLWLVVVIVLAWPASVWVNGKLKYREGRSDLLAEIARKNAPIQAIIAKGDRDAEVIEAEAIKVIGGQDDELKTAERKLVEAAKPKPVQIRTEYLREPEPDCPRVPAYCLAQ